MNRELPKVYEPQEVEGRVYRAWEENGCFRGVRDPEKKPFTIVMPPPNVTGQLHIGHAMDDAIQDMLIRYKRMQGYAALYLPGTDHAGIATQVKVEEDLRNNEGLSRYDLGMGLEAQVWQPHCGAAEEAGRVLRLGALPLYHGRGAFQGGAPRVCLPV